MAVTVPVPDAILVLTAGVSPPPVYFTDYEIAYDGANWTITKWAARLGTQPTPAQLAAVTVAQVIAARKAARQQLALAALQDKQGIGTALRAIYLAAGLTASQVQAQLPNASDGT